MASAKMSLNLKVEFGGGLELLFSNQRMHNITVPSTFKRQQKDQDSSLSSQEESPVSVTYLLHWLKDNVLKEREELFLEEDTVRPGILVLINDVDWELLGEGDYLLKDGDEIVMISTLHGG